MYKLNILLNLIKINTILQKNVFLLKFPSKISLVILKHLYEAKLIRSYYFYSYKDILNDFSLKEESRKISKNIFPYIKIYLIFFDSCFFYNSIYYYTTIKRKYYITFLNLQKLLSYKHFNFRYFLLISTNKGIITSNIALKYRIGGLLLFVLE